MLICRSVLLLQSDVTMLSFIYSLPLLLDIWVFPNLTYTDSAKIASLYMCVHDSFLRIVEFLYSWLCTDFF